MAFAKTEDGIANDISLVQKMGSAVTGSILTSLLGMSPQIFYFPLDCPTPHQLRAFNFRSGFRK
jgi:hypothetical protein